MTRSVLKLTVQSVGMCTARDDQGHLMLRKRIVPQSEVIRAIFLEDSPRCGVFSQKKKSGTRSTKNEGRTRSITAKTPTMTNSCSAHMMKVSVSPMSMLCMSDELKKTRGHPMSRRRRRNRKERDLRGLWEIAGVFAADRTGRSLI